MAELIRLADGRTVTVPEGTSVVEATKKLADAGFQIEDTGDEFSFFDKFGYAFGEGKADWQKAGAWLTSRFPIRFLDNHDWNSAYEESWFYEQATPDQRLDYIRGLQEQQAQDRNPELAAAVAAGNESLGAAGMLGGFAKDLMSPTSLAPLGKTYKGMAVIGGALGAEWEALDQLYKNEGMSAGDIATSGAIGAAFAPAAGALFKQVPKLQRAYRTRNTAANRQNATQLIQNYEDHTIRRMAQSGASDDITMNADTAGDFYSAIHQRVLKDMGITDERFLELNRLSDQTFKTPVSVTQARALVDAAEDRLGALIPQYRKPGPIGDLIGNISRQAERIDPELGMQFRRFDRHVAERTHDQLAKLDDWAGLLKMANKRFGKEKVKHAFVQNDENRLYAMFEEVGGAERAANAKTAFREVMDTDYDDLINVVGHDFGKIDGYMPTTVKDYRAMATEMAFKNPSTPLLREMERYKTRFKIKGELNDAQMATFMNRYARGQTFDPASKGNRHSQSRRIQRADITEEIANKYYADPIEAITEYIGRTANDVEKAKFFGTAKQITPEGELGSSLDVDESIGRWLAQKADEWSGMNRFDVSDKIEGARTLIEARFKMADQQPSGFLRNIRALGYLSTLPNPMTALVQLGDLGNAVYQYGLQDSFNALFRRGQKHISIKDMGLENTISSEMNTAGGLQKALDWTLSASGFRHLDRLGKETLVNAAMKRAQKIARGAPDSAVNQRWTKLWTKRFGEEGVEQLKADLREGKMTDHVKDYLWSSLADVQPIGQSELPSAYLNNPRARILYSLKSFAIKQLNFMGQEMFEDAKKNPAKAFRNFNRYMLTTGVAGMTVGEARRFLMGENVKPEDIPDAYAANLLKMFGLSEYLFSRYFKNGDIGAMAGEVIAPPYQHFVDAVNDVGKVAMGEVKDFDDAKEELKFFRNLPLGGRIMYNFFGGGLENRMKYNDSDSWLR